MAEKLLAAARKIAGPLERFEALPLEWTDGLDEAHVKVGQAITRLDQGDGVLILVDIFGGTPSNAAMAFLDAGKVEVISGVNLPMVVRLGCLGRAHMQLDELSEWIRHKGRDSICLGSQTQCARRQLVTVPDEDC
jgi:PTS system mannose-specific IIA component